MQGGNWTKSSKLSRAQGTLRWFGDLVLNESSLGLGSYLAFLTRLSSEATQTGMDTRRAAEGPAGVLDGTPRSPTEINAVDMPGCDAAVETR